MKPIRKYDIILVTPLEPSGAQDYFHLGLLILATFLKRKGYKVCYFDRNSLVYGQGISKEQIDRRLLDTIDSSDPTIVGFTFYTSYYDDISHCCNLIKERNSDVLCIAGGVHPTFEPIRTLEHIQPLDLAVMGPGESPVLDLLSGKSREKIHGVAFRSGGKVIINPSVPKLSDCSFIPDYDLIDADFYWYSGRVMFNGLRINPLATLVSSTPCPGKCRFCIGNKSKTQHFVQNEDRILAEMELLVTKFGVRAFWLADRDFVFDRKRAIRFARKKKKSAVADIPWATTSRVNQLDDELASTLHDSKCIAMCLGLESGSQRILDYLGKNTTVEQNLEAIRILDKNKILAMGSFILGLPTQTEEDIMANLSFFRKVSLHDSSVLMLMPVVGSEIYADLVERNVIDPDDPETWGQITGFDAHMNPDRNYSTVPFERFRELFHDQAVEIFETCKANRKKLTAKYGLSHYFESL